MVFLSLLTLRQRRKKPTGSQFESKKPRVNEAIRVPEVLLVDEEGNTKPMKTADALAQAKEQEQDLIEVSPKAKPPVVKIGDFGQYLYQLKKKDKKQRAHSKQTEVKTLRFGFRTEKHDMDRLMERAREFMGERHLVKFVVQLRGRELTNKAYAEEKLKGVVEALKEEADVEQEIKKQGNQFIVILRAKK